MDWFMKHLPDLLEIGSLIVATASAVAALTPSPKDDSFLAKLRGVLNVLALNVGNARPRK